jgi:beta-galactosidase
VGDTFIELPGWTKGNVWINGFNLGRYWKIGPQQTLYVPGPLLRVGQNDIIVLEIHGQASKTVATVNFVDAPILDKLNPAQ